MPFFLKFFSHNLKILKLLSCLPDPKFIISPGINLSLQTLHAAAARLPRIAVTEPKNVIGKNTTDAMSSGIYFGYIGLIKHLIEEITLELGYKTKIILTGGQANLFSEKIGTSNIVKKNLTIEGLYLAFSLQKKNARPINWFPINCPESD